MPLELQACAVRPLVERAAERLIALAQERQITINVDVVPDLVLVRADSELIIRVLQNLLDNAIKYSERGTAIHFSAFEGVNEAHASQPSGVLTIAVRDQGIGIAPEHHQKIFEKFGQAGQRRGGTGLGLTFCKLTVEAHGGRIWVESALGAGSTFFFTLPLHQAGSAQEPGDARD
jgi:signal transduction histidine kinase